MKLTSYAGDQSSPGMADRDERVLDVLVCWARCAGNPSIYRSDSEEVTMRDTNQRLHRTNNSCAECGAKFGLIRHYSWRTSVCSKRCLDRFKLHRERDRRWLFRIDAT
jgi:hypothetical protein